MPQHACESSPGNVANGQVLGTGLSTVSADDAIFDALIDAAEKEIAAVTAELAKHTCSGDCELRHSLTNETRTQALQEINEATGAKLNAWLGEANIRWHLKIECKHPVAHQPIGPRHFVAIEWPAAS